MYLPPITTLIITSITKKRRVFHIVETWCAFLEQKEHSALAHKYLIPTNRYTKICLDERTGQMDGDIVWIRNAT